MKTVRPTILALALLAACGGAEPADENPGTDAPPSAAFAQLARYTGLKGRASITVMAADDKGLASVELWADGVKVVSKKADGTGGDYTLIWDTTAVADGLVELAVRAVDSAGHTGTQDPVEVLVYNEGQRVVAEEGEVIIPADLGTSEELDKKHHWENVAGVGRIVGVLQWALVEESWDLELAVGWGECPDNGQVIGERSSDTTGAVLVEAVPTGDEVKTGMHFAHVRPVDAEKHKGQRLAYKVAVYTFAE